MDVDWAVAISAFLIFVGVGFAFYWGLFETNQNPVQDSLNPINQKILNSLQVDYWKAPVSYNSSAQGIAVLYFDYQWSEGTKNSARVLDSGLPLSCMLEGDRLYFEADVQEGMNYFDLTFSNSSSVPCSYPLETGNSSQATPLAQEKSRAVSQSRISQMLGTEYTQFRQSLGIARNFRVGIGSDMYGPQPPEKTNVYVKETHSIILETGQPVTIRVLVW
jgi:hypothetical protein